jgi:hypothetical protein
MKTVDLPPPTDPVVIAELTHAIENVVRGIRDPEAMRRAAERMDRMREEMRQRTGQVSVAVELLRESRDEA